MPNDTLWTGGTLEDLRQEFGGVYDGRTVLVTGADGFMGSHLTDALVELGATVHAFVRATSSGALNNIGHLRNRLKIHFADLTDRTSVDYLVRELAATSSDRPYVFHLGAQAHVGESWHRPYETVAANVLGTLNLLQAVVDVGLELEKFDTAGTSEEYGNVRETVSEHHDFDEDGGLILHERSPINPKSIYATAKVAADFLTMNYFDAFGVPGVVTRMFNNYGPRQNPRYVTGTIITQALTRETIELGALEPLRDFCFCTDGVRGHLTVAAHGTPGDVYVYGQGENISMRDWVDLILRVGEAEGFWAGDREVVSTTSRHRPGGSEVMALRVGHEKLTAETGWQPRVSWEQGVLRDHPLVRGQPRSLDRPRRLASDRRASPARLRATAQSCASSVHSDHEVALRRRRWGVPEEHDPASTLEPRCHVRGAHGRVRVEDALGVPVRAAQRDRDRVSVDGRPQGAAPGAQGDRSLRRRARRECCARSGMSAPARGATARRCISARPRPPSTCDQDRRARRPRLRSQPSVARPGGRLRSRACSPDQERELGECGGDEKHARTRPTARRRDSTSTAKPKQQRERRRGRQRVRPLDRVAVGRRIGNREEEDRGDGGNRGATRRRSRATILARACQREAEKRHDSGQRESRRQQPERRSDATASRRSHRFCPPDRAPTTRCRSSRPTSRRRAPARSGR